MSRQLSVTFDLPEITYKQKNLIEIQLQEDQDNSAETYDELINYFSASDHIFGEEFVENQLELFRKFAFLSERFSDNVRNCQICFSSANLFSEMPFFVDKSGKIHLPQQEQANSEWTSILNSIDIPQVHKMQQTYSNLKSAEKRIAYSLGLSYLSAYCFNFSVSHEYYAFLQNLISALNTNQISASSFGDGIYKNYSFIVIPSNDSDLDKKKWTSNSYGFIIPADASIQQIIDFIKFHYHSHYNEIVNNNSLDEQQVF